VRVLDQAGNPVRALGRPTSVAVRKAEFLHAPCIGVAFENRTGEAV
jgi:hypothetical protein